MHLSIEKYCQMTLRSARILSDCAKLDSVWLHLSKIYFWKLLLLSQYVLYACFPPVLKCAIVTKVDHNIEET